jgi:hypothetical protein
MSKLEFRISMHKTLVDLWQFGFLWDFFSLKDMLFSMLFLWKYLLDEVVLVDVIFFFV